MTVHNDFLFMYTQRVKQFYQNANFGPTIEDPPSFSTILDGAMFKPRIQSVSEGWNISHCLQQVIFKIVSFW